MAGIIYCQKMEKGNQLRKKIHIKYNLQGNQQHQIPQCV